MGGKTEAISIRTGVAIYKQPKSQGRGSPNWYARVYMPIDGKNLHTKSTKTTDQKEAYRLAEHFYGLCLIRSMTLDGTLPASQSVAAVKASRFDEITDDFLNDLKTAAGNDPRRLRNWKDHHGTVHGKGGLGLFFKAQDVNSITTNEIRKYLEFAVSKSRKGALASSSQKRIISTLSQILKFAYEKKTLVSLIRMPKIKLVDNPRPWFELNEYKKLYKTAFGLATAARKAGDHGAYLKWTEIGDFVVFMVGSFLRASEWANLKCSDIRFDPGDKEKGWPPYLEITVIRGKTGDRQSVTMQTAIAPFNRILKRNKNDASSFLFKPGYSNRQTAKERITDTFGELLAKANLTYDADGRKRSVYSLRHTALMLRITLGEVDSMRLAQNAGTSVEMLERFYLKRLRPRLNVAHLQRIRPV